MERITISLSDELAGGLAAAMAETRDRSEALRDLQVAALHVHLDGESCLEVAVPRGDAAAVIAERGARHGRASFVPVAVAEGTRARIPPTR